MKAQIITYGCRQNVSDSEKIAAVLEGMGYEMCDDSSDADLIIFNTCAVRENAEERVYGNVGALKNLKRRRPELLIGVCGCMARQEHVAERIRTSFRYVDMVFGTNSIHRLPEIVEEAQRRRVFEIIEDDELHEGLPVRRESEVVANIPIMYGCNNFCSYCIVPYIRGRERSRAVADVVREAADSGCPEVLLLGQNVNSYSSDGAGFCDLLRAVSEIESVRRIRFISSHPKDFSDELIKLIAGNDKICEQIHLPVQAGSDKVLFDMGRGYTKEGYRDIINKIRRAISNVTVTSDIIVGFPTERQKDFEETLELVREIEFDMLFTFIYSPRKGTKAADLSPILKSDDISANFQRLLAMQEDISYRKNMPMTGGRYEVLVEGESKTSGVMTGRTDGGKIVNFPGGSEDIGKLLTVEITQVGTWALTGKAIQSTKGE